MGGSLWQVYADDGPYAVDTFDNLSPRRRFWCLLPDGMDALPRNSVGRSVERRPSSLPPPSRLPFQPLRTSSPWDGLFVMLFISAWLWMEHWSLFMRSWVLAVVYSFGFWIGSPFVLWGIGRDGSLGPF